VDYILYRTVVRSHLQYLTNSHRTRSKDDQISIFPNPTLQIRRKPNQLIRKVIPAAIYVILASEHYSSAALRLLARICRQDDGTPPVRESDPLSVVGKFGGKNVTVAVEIPPLPLPAKDRADAQGSNIVAKCNALPIFGNSSWTRHVEDLLMLPKDRPNSYAVIIGRRYNVFAVPGKANRSDPPGVIIDIPRLRCRERPDLHCPTEGPECNTLAIR